MDDLNGEVMDAGLEVGHQRDEGVAEDDDVDIYQDLQEEDETMVKESDANFNVIERFNKLLDPKRRKDDFYEENVSEDDVDLYGDLNTFEKQLVAEELQAKVEVLEQKCSSLDSKNTELKAELDKVNKLNLALRRNISSIFKTAKAELERKDRQLKDLQREHDTLLFRRGAANNRMLPHNVNTPPTNVNPSPAIISSAPPAKTSMLNPAYIVTPSQNPTIPNFYEFKKDSDKGNLVTIENETECTFKMGPITLSFMSESSDFQKMRFERLENVVRDEEIEPVLKSSMERVNGEPSSEPSPELSSEALPQLLVERNNLPKELSNANENLEEGEFIEETTVATTVETLRKKQDESREMSRRKNTTHSGGRSRSSSRSRSPIDGKRKRSSSNERSNLRNSRAHDRGPPRRSQRSPVKSSRYRNSGNSHYGKSRFNRR